ncbi:hypothetical protein LSH36_247g02035 [Paralvinella palmiformis]|uniref:Uncharacterized protein n=1 Tax=Paralvinella palmiformis TaxID=53620 RepID=A0AAD9JME5_9ANNE|nr:hypothetical protein LSH36_247g02035 [Paralvinella palmiformis]
MIVVQTLGFLDRTILNDRLQQLKYMFRDEDSLSGIRTQEGLSPLVLALKISDQRRRQKMFNFLLSRGADISHKDPKYKRDVLMWTCYYGRVDQVSKLLDHAPGEFDLRDPDVDGMLPIHYAVRSGNPLCVLHLVKEMKRYRVPVDVPNPSGLTPLLEAKRLGYEMIAQILIKEGGACPSQFDTKRFRTKSRWSEAGHAEREDENQKRILEEVRIVGSFRAHTSYQKRRELSSNWQTLTGATTKSTGHFVPSNRPKTSPVHLETLRREEMYADLEIRDLQKIVEGQASVQDIRKLRDVEGTGAEAKVLDIPSDRYAFNMRQHGRVHVWPKLNLLMSLSEKASTLPTNAFANSVPSERKTDSSTNRPSANQSSHNAMLTSMLTSLSQQMSSAYRKTIVPKPRAVAVQPPSPGRRRKKDSTLAFIMKTTSSVRRTARSVDPLSRGLGTGKSTRASGQFGKKPLKSESKQPTSHGRRRGGGGGGGETLSHNTKQSQLARLKGLNPEWRLFLLRTKFAENPENLTL